MLRVLESYLQSFCCFWRTCYRFRRRVQARSRISVSDSRLLNSQGNLLTASCTFTEADDILKRKRFQHHAPSLLQLSLSLVHLLPPPSQSSDDLVLRSRLLLTFGRFTQLEQSEGFSSEASVLASSGELPTSRPASRSSPIADPDHRTQRSAPFSSLPPFDAPSSTTPSPKRSRPSSRRTRSSILRPVESSRGQSAETTP